MNPLVVITKIPIDTTYTELGFHADIIEYRILYSVESFVLCVAFQSDKRIYRYV